MSFLCRQSPLHTTSHIFTRAAAPLGRAQNGFYHGKGKSYGNRVSFSMRRTRRFWKPNIQWKTFTSELLGQKFQVPVSTKALRCIDKKGGIDSYVLYTPEKELNSKIGLQLKAVLIEAWEAKHGKKFSARQLLYEEGLSHWEKKEAVLNPLRETYLKQLLEITPKQQTE